MSVFTRAQRGLFFRGYNRTNDSATEIKRESLQYEEAKSSSNNSDDLEMGEEV